MLFCLEKVCPLVGLKNVMLVKVHWTKNYKITQKVRFVNAFKVAYNGQGLPIYEYWYFVLLAQMPVCCLKHEFTKILLRSRQQLTEDY